MPVFSSNKSITPAASVNACWEAKQKKEYILDRNGNKIYDPKKRQYKCKSVPATDWNEQTKAEEWRAAWARLCNKALEQNGHGSRIDHRSYERQRESGNLAADQIPTVHLGVAASAMGKRGIRTGRGGLNREIEVTNQRFRQLKARISKLQNWLKEEQENTEPPPLPTTFKAFCHARRGQENRDIPNPFITSRTRRKCRISYKPTTSWIWRGLMKNSSPR